jgi:hypothetical protein
MIVLIITFLSYEKVHAQDSIRTEVFSLSTCNPNGVSLIKVLDDFSKKREKVFKLETHSNRPTVFQITGINPLRFKYYINNEAVTQFMDASPFALTINSFVNGDYLLTAPEIRVPEIFKTDSISGKVRVKINHFLARNTELEDSIDRVNTRIEERWNFLYSQAKGDSERQANAANSDLTYKQLYNHLYRLRDLHDRNLDQYQMYIGGLPLNNPRFGILEHYRNTEFSENSLQDIDTIRRFQKAFAIEYLVHTARFKSIDSMLSLLESPHENTSYSQTLRHLKDSLRYYSFTWSVRRNSYYLPFASNELFDNINDVREQILNKRFQLYQEFVLNVATQIGVLVQNQFREYSSYNNALENGACIHPDSLESIEARRRKLINTFEYIQKTSAELQILVSYLDINTELYQSIARKINSNYLFLLGFLKNLDFVSRENTVQFTLPTHTNLKNIDLIRYTVKREDKVTKNIQTYNYDFWLKGGFKMDFSVGFFGTRLTDNVYNKVLLDTAGGFDLIRITRQDDGRTNFAFGGMVNVTSRNGASWINLGGSIGIAYSGNQRLQVLTGIALHLGKTERLIVHGGIGFGTIKYLDVSANNFTFYDRQMNEVKRENLSDVKEKNRIYMIKSPDIKYTSFVIPTVEKFVGRPFIGISYNLSKRNALQAVSGPGVQAFSDTYKNSVTN